MTIPQAEYCYKNHIPVVAYNELTKQDELCDIMDMWKIYSLPDDIYYSYVARVQFNCSINYNINVSNLIDITATINTLKTNNIPIKNENGSYRSIDDIGNDLLWLYLRDQSKYCIKTTEENKMNELCNTNASLSSFAVDSINRLYYTNSDPKPIAAYKFYCTANIKDVNIIVPNKVVEVIFFNGEKYKAVCKEPDVFSLEQAISICICKYLIGGSSAYNNAVKNGVKIYEDKLKKQQHDKEEQERIEKKRAKRLAYKARKSAKKAEAEKERQIEIQKEAYVRAMKELQIFSTDNSADSDDDLK